MHPEPFDGDESPHSGPKPERRRILPRSLNPMAFLGRVRPRATGELDPLSAKLKTCSLLTDAGDKALALLIDEGEWFSLPGGALLDRNGENDRALFIVLTGSLGVLVTNEHGEEKLVATIQAGDTVGEMSMISGEPHSAAIMALRDSELVRVSPALFDKLTARHPSVLLNLSRILVRRLRDTTRRAATGQRPKTFALVPLQSGVNCAPLVRRLEASLQSFGLDAMRLDRGAAEESAEFFQRIERQHAFVLYEGDTPDSAWSQMCLRQADRILFVIDASQGLPAHALRYAQIPALKRQLPDVVMLHKDDRISVEPLAPLLQSAQATVHHHIRANRLADIKRLARVIAGRSVGIVLAGGGARGFAHLGAAMSGEALTPYHVEAGIASLHAQASRFADTDWAQVRGYYDMLMDMSPSPVVAVNRAVAQAMTGDLEGANASLAGAARDKRIEKYVPYWLTRAEIAARAGDANAARMAYDRALALPGPAPGRRVIEEKRRALRP